MKKTLIVVGLLSLGFVTYLTTRAQSVGDVQTFNGRNWYAAPSSGGSPTSPIGTALTWDSGGTTLTFPNGNEGFVANHNAARSEAHDEDGNLRQYWDGNGAVIPDSLSIGPGAESLIDNAGNATFAASLTVGGNADVTGRIVSAPHDLTDSATIATDASLGNTFRVTLGGNRTLGNPTNPQDGQRVTWELIQDATGSRTITMDTKFSFGLDITGITLTTTPSKRDFITALYNSTADKWYVVGFVQGY